MNANINNLSDNQNESESIMNRFPLHAFPKVVQEILTEFSRVLNFNIDYMGGTLIYACSLAIGSKFKIQIKNKWIESAVVWVAIVGRPGINKSAPMSVLLEPFQELDKLNYQKYKEELLQYNAQILDAKSKSKKKNTNDSSDQEDIRVFIDQPKRKQFLLSDFTPEALSSTHEDNPSGIGIYTDELLTWINNFNRYTKSGEEQFYLSVWSCKDININRRNSPHIYIPNPFINVIGSIQPDKLVETFGKGRNSSGFTHRILFAYPDLVLREDFSDSEVSEVYINTYRNLILNIIGKRYSANSSENTSFKVIGLDASAKEKFKEWRSKNNVRINESKNDDFGGIYSKIEIYLLRLTLIIQILNDECNRKESDSISLEAIEAAIELTKYFEHTALKVNKLISKYNDPFVNYSIDKRIVYMALPTEFCTSTGEDIAKKFNMPRRTFFEFLADDSLFERQRHGYYFKKV